MGLLHLRSRSQWRFRMSGNVCPNIFRITEHFVTKFDEWCSVMSQSVMQKERFLLLLLSSRSRSQWGLIWSKYDSSYYIFWTVDSLATRLGLMIHHHKPECPVKKKKMDCCFQGRNVNVLSRWYLLTHQTFCFHTWYCDAYFQGQGYCKNSYDQYLTISTVSFEQRILLLPNLVWQYIIISQSVLLRNWIVVFKVKVTAKFQNVNDCLSRWYFLNGWTFLWPNLLWWCIVTSRLFSKKIGLLYSRSRSQLRIIYQNMTF